MSGSVTVAGVRFHYPDGREALTGVDLRIDAFQRVAVLGPNGAGKTTLALQLCGVQRPTSGTVAIDGMVLDDRTLPEIRRRVGLVFQDPQDMLFMPSVREDVAFGPANLGLRGEELARRVDESLALVGASQLAERAPHHLSAGEQRRAALAAVLAMRPDVLVLDEPSVGLDPMAHRELVDVLGSLPHTLVVITHDLPFALQLCERAVVMSGGRVVADAPTRELLLDADLLELHRLALPYGFDPRYVGR